jgi:quercetin dioxygenase-like cupin family protein
MTKEVFSDSKIYKLRETVTYAEGSIVSKVIARNQTINLTLFAFDKGQNLTKHSSPFTAMIQILDGSAIIEIGEGRHTLQQGEMIIMPANIPHAVESVTQFKMLLTMFKLEE